MKRTALALLFCFMFLATTSHVGHCVEITVDASASLGPVNTRLFGHNTVYMNGINGLWDRTTGAVKTPALSAMQNAGTGANALVRFPGGNHNDTYQWRRGVGPYDPGNPDDALYTKRPKGPNPEVDHSDKPYEAGYTNEFGTDELMQFISTACSGGKPLIGSVWRRQRA